MLFPCQIQVNNSLLPTRGFTSFGIKTVVFRMILICDVVFVLVYSNYHLLRIKVSTSCLKTEKVSMNCLMICGRVVSKNVSTNCSVDEMYGSYCASGGGL